jgi:acyl-CoA dehydrogenase
MNEHFGLEQHHRDLRTEVREYCESEIAPVVEEYGGGGYDYTSLAIVEEEFSRVWKFVAGSMNVAWTLVGNGIYTQGTEWQRDEWLRGLLTGELVGALSMTEPGAGSDASSISTTAERDGDEWVIDGHKHWTSYGEVADLIVVLARTGEGRHDLSLVGVPMPTPGERDGVEFVRDIDTMEGNVGVESEIVYDGLRVPAENVIGEPDEGFTYIMQSLDLGRIGTAAQAVGVAQGAFEAAREFAGTREQFGKPIRKFQGVAFKLADMKMEIDAARLLTMQAAEIRDRGERASLEAAMAKTYATDVAMDVTTEAVQIHGARGYSKDYPVERFMREAKGTQIYEGTNEINRQIIANHLYD